MERLQCWATGALKTTMGCRQNMVAAVWNCRKIRGCVRRLRSSLRTSKRLLPTCPITLTLMCCLVRQLLTRSKGTTQVLNIRLAQQRNLTGGSNIIGALRRSTEPVRAVNLDCKVIAVAGWEDRWFILAGMQLSPWFTLSGCSGYLSGMHQQRRRPRTGRHMAAFLRLAALSRGSSTTGQERRTDKGQPGVHFRLFQMPCCGQLLCWVNPRLPNHCPECGTHVLVALRSLCCTRVQW